jgi:hypothetical protein
MKYFQPKSVTWWSGLALVAVGVYQAYSDGNLSAALSDPHVAQGLGLIGIRGAISKSPLKYYH